ncbi:type VI secretion lipoprotein TssJ [Oceanobacter mangrovi]|uniref:type VI secretion lipoprotein TssJ n=1 Tax=Oceanobacter mangrovi TaxID=2862510 RepID=UPI001C8E36AA|nr:type VI secretion lipoprotein TssJ [Oceanobacter mangrovi]
MKKFIAILGLVISQLAMQGCATKPLAWNGSIEDEPPLSIDDANESGNNWVWLDQTSDWFYRDGDPVKADYMTWDYDGKGIAMRFVAPKQLNLHSGKPHTLYLRVYQLSDLKVFNDISKSQAGIRELLTSAEIDPTFLTKEEYVIAPDEMLKVTLERMKETRFVAIVAGYYQLDPKEVVRVFPIPAVAARNDGGWMTRLNPFADDLPPEAARIKAWVDLGVTKVSRLQMIAE